MVVRKGLLADASEGWKEALVSAGFKKRSGDIYTFSVSANGLGWLGLNRAVNRADGLVEVNPVVGVRHQPIERVVAELVGQKFHEYTPPTISVHIGYVMPEGRYHPWFFGVDRPVGDVVAEMVEAILGHGLRFMKENASLEAIVQSMAAGQVGIREQIAFRLPVGYLLMGDRERAEEAVRASLQQLGDRDDLAAQRFREFASAFARWARDPDS